MADKPKKMSQEQFDKITARGMAQVAIIANNLKREPSVKIALVHEPTGIKDSTYRCVNNALCSVLSPRNSTEA